MFGLLPAAATADTHDMTTTRTTATKYNEDLGKWFAYIIDADGTVAEWIENAYDTERGAKIAAALTLRSYR